MDYLIKDYGTKDKPNDEPKLRIVSDTKGHVNNLWRELDAAKHKEQLISVYPIPDCVLDWS